MSVDEKMTGITPVAFTCTVRTSSIVRQAQLYCNGLLLACGNMADERGDAVGHLEGQVRLLREGGVAVAAGVVHGDLSLCLGQSHPWNVSPMTGTLRSALPNSQCQHPLVAHLLHIDNAEGGEEEGEPIDGQAGRVLVSCLLHGCTHAGRQRARDVCCDEDGCPIAQLELSDQVCYLSQHIGSQSSYPPLALTTGSTGLVKCS